MEEDFSSRKSNQDVNHWYIRPMQLWWRRMKASYCEELFLPPPLSIRVSWPWRRWRRQRNGTIYVTKLGRVDRQLVVKKALATNDEDNYKLLSGEGSIGKLI
ncbi:hypothetical protein ACFE04_013446 [Oxalis oulophora]